MNTEAGWRDEIVSTPDVLRGKPRIKGTRIPVSLVLGYLAAGRTAEDIRREFPDLTPEQIAACLRYARPVRARSRRGMSLRFFADHCVSNAAPHRIRIRG